MHNQEIIKALNRNLEKEYASVLFYLQIVNLVDAFKERRLKTIISRLSEDEVRHAEKLAERITELGGKSSWRVAHFEKKRTLKESIEQIIASEDEAIGDYTELMSKTEDEPKVWITLKEIVEEEIGHRTRAEALLRANATLFQNL